MFNFFICSVTLNIFLSSPMVQDLVFHPLMIKQLLVVKISKSKRKDNTVMTVIVPFLHPYPLFLSLQCKFTPDGVGTSSCLYYLVTHLVDMLPLVMMMLQSSQQTHKL